MKKISGVLTPLLALAVLILGACPNAADVDPAGSANDALASGRTITVAGVVIDPGIDGISITVPSGDNVLHNVDNQEALIEFTSGAGDATKFQIDANTLLAALEVRELKVRPAPGGTPTSREDLAPSEYQATTNLVRDIKYVNKNQARIGLNLNSLTTNALEIHVKADVLTANNGSGKLNLDGDLTPGEAGDDDIYEYTTVVSKTGAGTTPLTNADSGKVERDPRAGIGVSFGALNAAVGSSTQLLERIDVMVSTAGDVERDAYLAFVKANLVIEKYVNGAWTALPVSSVTDITSVATDPIRTIRAVFAPEDRAIVRARLSGLKTLATANQYYGFVQKYTTKDNAADIIERGPSYSVDLTADTTVPAYNYQKYTNGSIAGGNSTVIADGNKANVIVKVPLNTADGFTGGTALTDTTVTPANIKIVATVSTTQVELPWESFSYETGSVAADGKVTYTALLLKLPAGFRQGTRSFVVLISPDVKNGDGRSARPDAVYNKLGSPILVREVTGTGTL
jgi:hypothetical protein